MEDGAGVLIALVIFILGGVALLITAMNNRRRLAEIAYRERVAMIERGLVPAPEVDPAGFEAATGLGVRPGPTGERYRTAGVIMIGFGLSLMVLLSFAAGVPSTAIGVGGAWAVLGGACLLNYFLISRRDLDSLRDASKWRPAAGRRPPEPPVNLTP